MDAHTGAARRPGRRGALALGSAAAVAAAGAGARAVRKRRGLPPVEDLLQVGRGGEIRSVTASDGLKLHVEVDGPDDAPLTVIFAHGWTVDLSSWRELRAALADSPVRRVFYDQRGHGRSDYRPGSADLRQLGLDLYAVLEAVAPSGPVVLAGHSMGGMTVMALAGTHPELFGPRVKGAMLVATSAGDLRNVTLGLPSRLAQRIHLDLPGFLNALERRPGLSGATGLAPYMLIARRFLCDRTASRETLWTVAALVSAMPKEVMGEFLGALHRHDEAASLAALGRTRTVVVAGDSDKLTPAPHTELVAREIPGAEYVLVPHCGHMVLLEHPEVLLARLRELIAAAQPDGST